MKTLLETAKNLVKERWIKEAYWDTAGGYCMVGALNKAAVTTVAPYDTHVQAIKQVAGVLGGDNEDDIIEFNDDDETTKEKVLEVFDKAINSL